VHAAERAVVDHGLRSGHVRVQAREHLDGSGGFTAWRRDKGDVGDDPGVGVGIAGSDDDELAGICGR